MTGEVPGPSGVRVYSPSLSASPSSLPFINIYWDSVTHQAPAKCCGPGHSCLCLLAPPTGKSSHSACPPWRLCSDVTRSQKHALPSTPTPPEQAGARPPTAFLGPCLPLITFYLGLQLSVYSAYLSARLRGSGLAERAWTLEPCDLALNPSLAT